MLTMVMMAAAVATAAPRPAIIPEKCRKSNLELTAQEDGKADFRRLGELPPAAHVLTLFRKVDGCPMPVVLREGIGSSMPTRPMRQ